MEQFFQVSPQILAEFEVKPILSKYPPHFQAFRWLWKNSLKENPLPVSPQKQYIKYHCVLWHIEIIF